MKTTAPITVALLCSPIGTAAGDEKSSDRDPWNGFGVGSWVVQTESFTQGDKAQTTRKKLTRAEPEKPGEIRLRGKKEGTKPGTFDGEESTSWHIPGYDPALDPKCKLMDTSKQDLVIQGDTNHAGPALRRTERSAHMPLIGTDSGPAVKRGEVVTCLYRDRDCTITTMSAAPIPWPRVQPRGEQGGSGLWVGTTPRRTFTNSHSGAPTSPL